MSILKKISKTKLVFMVTHNQELATRFADRIITIKDGRVHLDKKINTNNNSVYINKAHKRSLFSSWSNKILKSNLKKRIPRHVLSFFALLTGLTSSILIGCFSLSAGEAIKKASYRQFDYGSATIAKESTQQINGSPISLVKMSRPNKTELKELSEKYFRFHFFPNFDYLFPNSMVVKTQSSKELDLSFISTCNPNSSHHSALLKKGKLMDEDNLFEMVINESCYDYIKKETDLEPLGLTLNIKHDFLYRNYVDESNYVDEIYSLDETFKIVGIVDELTFLSTPKVFYSYRALSSYLANKMMEKTSLYLGYEYSWLNKVTDCGDNEILSSYSYRIFLKENEELEEIEKAINEANDDFKIDSNSYTITSSLLEITNASNLGMDIFLAIALIGSVLLLGIVTFSCYSDDRSKLALFSILGSSKKENIDLIAQESLIVGLSSSTFSLILAPLIALLINKICSLMGLSETLIVINYGMLFGIPYFIPLFTIIITIIICLLSTYVPLLFSHKNSLREELSLS